MKVIACLAFLAYVAVIYGADDAKPTPIVCPPVNGVNATLMPNPYNCNSYFVCESGTPIAMKCPKGLHFNAKEKVCDYPATANCKEVKP